MPIGRARARQGKGKDSAVPIKGLIPGMAVHYARCCHPLPGDRIVGIVTTGKGVTVHTIDCETLERFQDTPERWVDLAWDVVGEADRLLGRLYVVVANEPGSLGSLSTIIGKNQGNISNLKITNRSIGLLRDADRCRGHGCEAPDQYHSRAARDARHHLGRTGPGLSGRVRVSATDLDDGQYVRSSTLRDVAQDVQTTNSPAVSPPAQGSVMAESRFSGAP